MIAQCVVSSRVFLAGMSCTPLSDDATNQDKLLTMIVASMHVLDTGNLYIPWRTVRLKAGIQRRIVCQP